MKNQTLDGDLETILKNKTDISISKGKISGSSIDVVNTRTSEDIGSYPYYKKQEDRNADFINLEALLKN